MVLFAFTAALTLSTGAAPAPKAKADHLVMLVFDSMRPDYIDRFALPNFKRLRKSSREYVNGYVGHMGAETVVSHLVLPSGRLPRALPWLDEVYVDHAGVLGTKGAVHATGGLEGEKLHALMRTLPAETFLTARMKSAHGGKVFAVAQKSYAAWVFGTPAADAVITMKKADGRCTPAGLGVPSYIAQNARYTLECSKTYGTEASFYPLDGSRSVPGDDPAHQGGDIWVADVGLAVMGAEPWSTLLLSFAGIDKISHMSAEHEGPRPNSFQTEYTLEKVARIADAQLGRVLDALEAAKLTERTVLVVTADHGGQSNTSEVSMRLVPGAAGGGRTMIGESTSVAVEVSATTSTRQLPAVEPGRQLFEPPLVRIVWPDWATQQVPRPRSLGSGRQSRAVEARRKSSTESSRRPSLKRTLFQTRPRAWRPGDLRKRTG